MHPTPWTVLAPLATCIDDDRPQRWAPIEAGSMLDQVLYDINLVEDARRGGRVKADDGSPTADTVVAVCDELERVYEEGSYPLLEVTRPWSTYNPVIDGELARPAALRSYLGASSATCSPRGRSSRCGRRDRDSR